MGTISFARGVPSADLLPVDDLRAAAAKALNDNPAGALSYSPGGYRPLREWIGERHGVSADRVLMLNGSLQGVTFVAQHLFHESGGRLVVEDPTYDRTLIAMRTYGAEIAGVALTPDGIDTDALERVLDAGSVPKLLYVIPAFQNPSGLTLSLERRHRLLDLCRERGVLVMEDDPYGLLRFEGEALPTLHELDGGDNVIHSSSFTKTVAPGIRTGYLVLPERLVGPLARISENTVIGPNTFAEATLDAYCRAGRFEPNVERATAALKERRDAMESRAARALPIGRPLDDAPRRLLLLGRPAGAVRHRGAAWRRDRAGRPLREGWRLLRRRRRPLVAAAGVQCGHAGADRRGHRPPRGAARRATRTRRGVRQPAVAGVSCGLC